ncbi:MAG: 50S ribosomal protein L9 [Candidatus Limimorpha sp.]|jgi:large subunit ribosomal protein L9|nr:50S ribosomal protein L9 [Bacteroidales bacterium]MDD5977916.1 50S ribosomal protein L9 [Bacteroidales bacterium]MDD7276780.1 50S ribosomal protein L9 [Bacteroidales bacterium]MDY6075193.1 50S ribosomal protein L9 [Bacteroidales bacterium]
MQIILIQDVKNLGYKNDIVNVKPGYARNYLIPQGMAILATESARKVLAENMRQQAYKQEKIKKEAQDIATLLEGLTLRIPAKAAATGKIFGSVNNVQIANAIKEAKGIEIDRKQIMIDDDTIKEVGNYTAKIRLHKEVSVDINFEVFAE